MGQVSMTTTEYDLLKEKLRKAEETLQGLFTINENTYDGELKAEMHENVLYKLIKERFEASPYKETHTMHEGIWVSNICCFDQKEPEKSPTNED